MHRIRQKKNHNDQIAQAANLTQRGKNVILNNSRASCKLFKKTAENTEATKQGKKIERF